ncbi:MAG: efflux transporter outer membrane subunit, partial [Planctomycetota bacterium]
YKIYNNSLLFIILSASLLLTGCSLLLPEHDMEFEKEIPTSYSLTGETSGEKFWWKEFNSVELDSLIVEAFARNLTLKEAWLRLKQANQVVIKSKADLQPSIDFSGDTSRKRTLENTIGRKDGRVTRTRTASTLKSFALGLAASYELDVWGKLRDTRKASKLLADASRADVESAAITLTAEITELWLKLAEQRSKLKLLKDQLDLNKKQLELIELRQRKSLATALDVYQQRQIVAQTQAQIPLSEIEEKATLYKIAILLGKPPTKCPELKVSELPGYRPLPATGIPADILENRPDLRAAKLRLESADWNVAAAKADRLPALKLSGTASVFADSTGSGSAILDNWYLNLASGLTAPLWDGKRRKAEVIRLRAEADSQLLSYRKSILAALNEVEDAILRETKQQEYLAARLKQEKFASNSYKEAKERYMRGLNDYLPVLQALESKQKLDREIIEIKAKLLSYRTALYRSLGGRWTMEIIKEGTSNDQ